MTTDGIEFNNRRSVVSQHANISSRLLNNIAVWNKLVRILGVLKLVTAVALKVKEKIAAKSLCN